LGRHQNNHQEDIVKKVTMLVFAMALVIFGTALVGQAATQDDAEAKDRG
jgi:hypothetical protein